MQPQQPESQKNLLLAIILSVGVLLGWQVFYAGPKLKEEQERQARLKQQQASEQTTTAPGSTATGPVAGGAAPQAPGAGSVPGAPAPTSAGLSRDAAIATVPRLVIETPSLKGSLSLRGGRIDDLMLVQYRETVDPKSPNVVLFSPAEAPSPYFAEHGWVPAPGTNVKVPDRDTLWRSVRPGQLTPATPAVLEWDNGQGLVFTRTIGIDNDYLLKIVDEVENRTGAEVRLFPYARIYRYGTPKIEGFFIQHEGLIGFVGDKRLLEVAYSDALKDGGGKTVDKATGGWIGFTDKYWAAALVPPQGETYRAALVGQKAKSARERESFQADYLLPGGIAVPAGQKRSVEGLLFAGAKKVGLINEYGERNKIVEFGYLIDWGWFYFITKPLYQLIDWLYQRLGNFGFAILAVTVIVKALFFWFANKSYESMAKMKKLQPEMERLRERYKDDRQRQQQELMALYQKEKINPLAGCLPILVQIPVFFALYKVLFISIDMRHAPFIGWIRDLSAPDPTSFVNLFGLLPWPAFESYLFGHTVGAWPIVMGITMWFQMQLNPQQPDPTQQMIFNWMPPIFTILLAGFASGLVIYWAWNNVLSLIQQYVIMKKNGVDVPLIDNLKKTIAPLASLIGGRAKTNSKPGK